MSIKCKCEYFRLQTGPSGGTSKTKVEPKKRNDMNAVAGELCAL